MTFPAATVPALPRASPNECPPTPVIAADQPKRFSSVRRFEVRTVDVSCRGWLLGVDQQLRHTRSGDLLDRSRAMGYPLPAPVVEHDTRIDSEQRCQQAGTCGATCETSVTSDG